MKFDKRLTAPALIFVLGLIITSYGLFTSRSNEDAKRAESVVKILNAEETGGGTGWVTYARTGARVIVTNDHVCGIERGGLVTIEQYSGEKSLRHVIKRNFLRDLCLIEGVSAPALTLANKSPKPFDAVKVMGHPLLKPTAPSYGQYTKNGIVPVGFHPDELGACPATATKFDGFFGSFCIQKMELSYTTVPIYPGNSGSPVVNKDGEVIGVMNSADSQSNQGMFIPLPFIKEMLND